ncbi:MAG TPA: response regulator [Microvirga sp.]|nr:response regulator [Microvirga sp.]
MRDQPLILAADDSPDSLDILRWHLQKHGYQVATAENGQEALAMVSELRPDLVLLDIMMPKLDGIAAARQIKDDESLGFIPVILLTARADVHGVAEALDAGGDDYLAKPFESAALLARARSALRQKALHDLVQTQASALAEQARELSDWNSTLEERVAAQVQQIERMERLRRFLPPQVADQLIASPDAGKDLLESHRRDVTVVFCDLRGFTRLTVSSDPDEVMRVLREYHAGLGELITRYEGTLERFVGDGLLVVFNDPLPCEDHTERAVRMALEMRTCVAGLADEWRARGHKLGFGIGISQGTATLGGIGFERRVEYSVIGTVPNLAARLCEAAADGQILVSRRVLHAVERIVEATRVGDLTLKGFARPMAAYNLVRLRDGA